jgi:DNA primase catalytic core
MRELAKWCKMLHAAPLRLELYFLIVLIINKLAGISIVGAAAPLVHSPRFFFIFFYFFYWCMWCNTTATVQNGATGAMHQHLLHKAHQLKFDVMIPTTTVQQILEATRIEDVVSEFLSLRKRGSNLVALCPFHAENTPSFTVNPVRNIFNCFGCGQKGDAIKFLQVHEQMSFPEAIRWLGQKYNIEVPETTTISCKEDHQSEAIMAINNFAHRYFRYRLTQCNYAQAYVNERGILTESLETFGIGYANGPNDLSYWLKKRQYDIPLSESIGLTIQGRDFFRKRLIFPIHNLSGKVIGFAGRSIGGVGEGQQPKYLNSRESIIYQKARSLYGLYQAKQSLRRCGTAVLVEGYLDVIALHQAGITNAVASGGTAITTEQMMLIKRNANRVVICYDGDAAGYKATMKAIQVGITAGLQVSVATLPAGHDPDSFTRTAGSEAMKAILAAAQDWLEYLISNLWVGNAAPTAKADTIRDIAGLISQISDSLVQTAYLRRLVEVTGFPEAEIQRVMPIAVPGQNHHRTTLEIATIKPNLTKEITLEYTFILALLQHGEEQMDDGSRVGEYLLGDFECVADAFTDPLYQQIATEALRLVTAGMPVWSAYFAAHEISTVREVWYEAIADDTGFDPKYIKSLLLTFKIAKLDALLLRHRQTVDKDSDLAFLVHKKILNVKAQLIAQANVATI